MATGLGEEYSWALPLWSGCSARIEAVEPPASPLARDVEANLRLKAEQEKDY
jgi:hypothetical protein